jgi:hypothetical protein
MTMLPTIREIDPGVRRELEEMGEGYGQCQECYSSIVKLHLWPWAFRTCDCECWERRTRYEYRIFNLCPWGRA